MSTSLTIFFIYFCSPAKMAKMAFALHHLWWKGCARFFAQVLEGEAVDGGETNLSLTSLGDQYHLKSIKVFINQPEILLICVMMEN